MTDIPIELEACPFCGEALVFSETFGWEHGGDDRRCIADNIVLQDADDIDAWNTRAPDPALKECVEALDFVERSLSVDMDMSVVDILHRADEARNVARATLAAMTKGEE